MLPFSALTLSPARDELSYFFPVFGSKENHCNFQASIFIHGPPSHSFPLREKGVSPSVILELSEVKVANESKKIRINKVTCKIKHLSGYLNYGLVKMITH